ncbi:uncharacterized protein [Miscanthus floridulus]|uniref:uncharacterized protein n=1 Tax=Miscanthus floridulus TaxID=154761 RepID=UPI003457FAE6
MAAGTACSIPGHAAASTSTPLRLPHPHAVASRAPPPWPLARRRRVRRRPPPPRPPARLDLAASSAPPHGFERSGLHPLRGANSTSYFAGSGRYFAGLASSAGSGIKRPRGKLAGGRRHLHSSPPPLASSLSLLVGLGPARPAIAASLPPHAAPHPASRASAPVAAAAPRGCPCLLLSPSLSLWASGQPGTLGRPCLLGLARPKKWPSRPCLGPWSGTTPGWARPGRPACRAGPTSSGPCLARARAVPSRAGPMAKYRCDKGPKAQIYR